MPTCVIHGRQVSFKGILFDKDGTLLDFLSLWGAWAHEVTEQLEKRILRTGSHMLVDAPGLLGLVFDPEGKVKGYDPKGPVAMATEEQTTGILAWQLYRAGLPWNEALLEVRELLLLAMQKVKEQRNARPMPGLIEVLEQCCRLEIPLGVVTADRTAEAKEHLRWTGIDSYFEVIIGTDRVTRGKPEPDMVYLACRELGLAPDEVIVIGDSNGDMQMAKAAGAALAVGYSMEGDTSYLLQADVIIREYADILLR